MSLIKVNYDPQWEAYKASMGPGPIQTAQEKADQEKLDADIQNLYSQSLGSRNYLTPDQFNATYPGVKQWAKEQSDWQKQLEEGFAKKYGHSPILGTTFEGPPSLSRPTNPGGQGDLSAKVAPPDVIPGNPNAKLVGPGTGSTSPWYDASGVKHPGSSTDQLLQNPTHLTAQQWYSQPYGGTPPGSWEAANAAGHNIPPTTTAPTTTAPVIPPSTINPITTSAVTPPATSPLRTNLLVTQPGATAAQNTIASLQNLLGRSAVGGVGSFKMPDLFKQTQQKWGGFSPAAFSNR